MKKKERVFPILLHKLNIRRGDELSVSTTVLWGSFSAAQSAQQLPWPLELSFLTDYCKDFMVTKLCC